MAGAAIVFRTWTMPQKAGEPVKRPQLVLGLIWLMMFVAYFDRINITVAGPAIVKTLGLEPAAFGLVLSAFTFGYALMQIPGGALADRFGSRPLLIFALVFWSAFTGLTGLATSLTVLVIVRVFFGLGEGLENGAQFKLIGDYFPSRERSGANAAFLSALSLGPAIAAPLAGWLVVQVGWRGLFFWFTIPGLLVAILLAFLLPRTSAPLALEQGAKRSGGWGEALGARPTWLVFAAYLCFNVAFWGFIGWMPSYLNATGTSRWRNWASSPRRPISAGSRHDLVRLAGQQSLRSAPGRARGDGRISRPAFRCTSRSARRRSGKVRRALLRGIFLVRRLRAVLGGRDRLDRRRHARRDDRIRQFRRPDRRILRADRRRRDRRRDQVVSPAASCS